MIKINSDVNIVTTIRKMIEENDGYCPCRLEKTPDTKCMCKEFKEQKEGSCHCGLYYKTKEEK